MAMPSPNFRTYSTFLIDTNIHRTRPEPVLQPDCCVAGSHLQRSTLPRFHSSVAIQPMPAGSYKRWRQSLLKMEKQWVGDGLRVGVGAGN
jgi:hypothetical protein